MPTPHAIVELLFGPTASQRLMSALHGQRAAAIQKTRALVREVLHDLTDVSEYLRASLPEAAARSTFYRGLLLVPPNVALMVASFQFNAMALLMVPDARMRIAAALALAGGTIVAIELALASVARGRWLMMVLCGTCTALLVHVQVLLARARVAMIVDEIRNAVGAAGTAGDPGDGSQSLVDTLLPILSACLPLMGVALEILAGAATFYVLNCLLAPEWLAYRQRTRLRRRLARLEARLSALDAMETQSSAELPANQRAAGGLAGLASREGVAALICAILFLLGFALSATAAPLTGAASARGCPAESERVAHLVDLTRSRRPEARAADADAVSTALSAALPCSRHVVIGITGNSWGEPLMLADVSFPADGWMNQEIRRARAAAAGRWQQVTGSQAAKFSPTDVIGAFAYAAAILRISPDHPAKIYSYSDLRESRSLPLEEAKSLSADAVLNLAVERLLVPDLAGADVWMLGVSTSDKTPVYWTTIREFWTSWVAKSGARLRLYAVDWKLCGDGRPCDSGVRPPVATRVAPLAPPLSAPAAGPRPAVPEPASATSSDRDAGNELAGAIGSSGYWKSGWIDLFAIRDVRRGDRFRLHLGGTATRMIVRFLAKDENPNDPAGIDGGVVEIPGSRIVELTAAQAHRGVRQISVHGGPAPFGLHTLGEKNGGVTLLRIEPIGTGGGTR